MKKIIADRYRVEKVLGKGAAGTVYLVRDKLEDDNLLALKLLQVPGARHLELLRLEFTILTSLRHPNIAGVFDFGLDEKSGLWFYTSEFLEGETITDACKGLNFVDQSRLFAQVLRALQHIHSQGIVHYDVKPSNIIVVDGKKAKLIDFGLATTETPLSSAMRGTIGYAAPEVVRGELGDPRSDLYSLGAVFYNAVTGRPPFVSDTPLAALQMQATSDPGRPRKFNPEIPLELERIVTRLLDRDPTARFNSAGEVNRALSQTMDISIEEETAETAMAYLLGGGFVGRDRELKRFRSFIGSLKDVADERAVKFITGETGIGKTRLMREVGYYAQLKGFLLIRTRCMQSHDRPFGPFANALDVLSGKLVEDAGKRYSEAIRYISGRTDNAQTPERDAAIHDAGLLFIEAAKLNPVVISIDDSEEADDDTLAFLSHLAQLLWLNHQKNVHIPLIVLCACNTEVKSAAAMLSHIERMTKQGIAETTVLQPLSKKAYNILISALLGGTHIRQTTLKPVLEAAGGNPLIIEQTVRQLFEAGLLFYEAGKWRISDLLAGMPLPSGGEEALVRRLETLSADERAGVDGLACLGRPSDFELISTASGLTARACAKALDRLISRRLLFADEENNYSFVSGRMGDVSLREIPSGRRREIHGRIYEYLAETGGDLLERALHGHLADIDNDVLVPLLTKAMQKAKNTAALFMAIRLSNALFERVPEDGEIWFEAMDTLAELYMRSGQSEEQNKLLKLAKRDSLWEYPEIASRIITKFVGNNVRAGKFDKVEAFVQKALKKFDRPETTMYRARILADVGSIEEAKGNHKKAYDILLEAREESSRHKDQSKVDMIDYRLATLEFRLDLIEDSERRASAALGRKSASKQYGHLHNALGVVYMTQGKQEKALAEFQKALDRYEKDGNLSGESYVRQNMGILYLNMGEFEKALDTYAAARPLLHLIDDKFSSAACLINMTSTQLAAGKTKDALASSEQAVEIAREIENSFLEMGTLISRGDCRRMLGKTKSALSDLNASCKIAQKEIHKSTESTLHFLKAWTLAYLCGDIPAAENELSLSRSLIETDTGEPASGQVMLEIQLALLFLDTEKAERLFEEIKTLELQGTGLGERKLVNAEILLALGRKKDAENALHTISENEMNRFARIRKSILATRIELSRKNLDSAVNCAKEARNLALPFENPVLIVEADLISAACAVAEGDNSQAIKYKNEAEETFSLIADELPEGYDVTQLRALPLYSGLDSIAQYIKTTDSTMQELEAFDEDFKARRKLLEDAGIDEQLLTRDGLALLGMISRLAAAELDVDKLLDLALGMLLDVTRAERGFIILVDEEGNFRHLAAHDILDEEITSPEYRTSHTMVQKVISSGKSRLVLDTTKDETLREAKSIVDLGLRSVLSVPIILEKKTIGVVYLDTTSLARSFTQSDITLIEAFSERISPMIMRAVELEMQEARLHALEDEVRTRYAYTNIIGRSKPMREMFRILDSVTDTDLTVYIYGKTGTGKELVAKALHYNSSRKDAPFISINCGAMAESLLDSELFGHVKGAFTGANADKPGLIESANRGTLFLDEIGSMPVEMQVKLLRAIEEREVRRIGAAISSPVDIRLVCSTNTPLEKLVEQGVFREDLFYRLNVVRIELPPLSKRREDIPLLVEHFLDLFAGEMKTPKKNISPEALELFIAGDWPGNVRELENRLRQAVALAPENTIRTKHVQSTDTDLKPGSIQAALLPDETLKQARDRIEKELIISALTETDYNYSRAAKRLGMARTWLHRRAKQLGIERK